MNQTGLKTARLVIRAIRENIVQYLLEKVVSFR